MDIKTFPRERHISTGGASYSVAKKFNPNLKTTAFSSLIN